LPECPRQGILLFAGAKDASGSSCTSTAATRSVAASSTSRSSGRSSLSPRRRIHKIRCSVIHLPLFWSELAVAAPPRLVNTNGVCVAGCCSLANAAALACVVRHPGLSVRGTRRSSRPYAVSELLHSHRAGAARRLASLMRAFGEPMDRLLDAAVLLYEAEAIASLGRWRSSMRFSRFHQPTTRLKRRRLATP